MARGSAVGLFGAGLRWPFYWSPSAVSCPLSRLDLRSGAVAGQLRLPQVASLSKRRTAEVADRAPGPCPPVEWRRCPASASPEAALCSSSPGLSALDSCQPLITINLLLFRTSLRVAQSHRPLCPRSQRSPGESRGASFAGVTCASRSAPRSLCSPLLPRLHVLRRRRPPCSECHTHTQMLTHTHVKSSVSSAGTSAPVHPALYLSPKLTLRFCPRSSDSFQ